MSPLNLLPENGILLFFPAFFSAAESEMYTANLTAKIRWQQRPVKLFGREILQPRLTESFADAGVSYGYSGIALNSRPWTDALLAIRSKVEKRSGETFNTALLNYYRDGKDYMGWHRDNEKALGKSPPVASVSLGASRIFQLRRYDSKQQKMELLLNAGDLLLMSGDTQRYWEHRLPRAPKNTQPRINITFRRVKNR